MGIQQRRRARRLERAPGPLPHPPDLRFPAGPRAARPAVPRRAGSRPADAGGGRAFCRPRARSVGRGRMIATGRFVFLHLHKSGGTFVNECLLRFVPGARRIGYHLPRSLVPAELAKLPALGFVRNPWCYYVSWYAFQAARAEPNALFRVLSDEGRRDFKGTLRGLLDLGGNSGDLDRVLAMLPASYGTRGINLPGFALA